VLINLDIFYLLFIFVSLYFSTAWWIKLINTNAKIPNFAPLMPPTAKCRPGRPPLPPFPPPLNADNNNKVVKVHDDQFHRFNEITPNLAMRHSIKPHMLTTNALPPRTANSASIAWTVFICNHHMQSPHVTVRFYWSKLKSQAKWVNDTEKILVTLQ